MSAQDLPLLESQQQLVSRLQNLFELSAPFALLAGEQGSGRTTLCQQWLAAASPAGRCVVVNCQAGLSLSRLREQLISALLPGAIFDPDDPLVDSVLRLLSEQSRLLIVVDDADLAPEGWLQELWELYCINEALPAPHRLSVLLCATPEWVAAGCRTLAGHPLPPVELDVEPLSTAEQTSLLEFCLRRGNYYALMPNPAALAERLRHCAGNPGRVVALAEDIMTRKSMLKSNDWLSNKMLASIGVAAAVVILLSWVLPPLFKGGASTTNPPAASAADATGTVVAPAPTASSASPATADTGTLPHDVSGAGDAAASGDQGKRRVVIADQVVRDIMTSQQGGSAAVATAQPDSEVPAVSGAVTSVSQLAPVAAEMTGANTPQVAAPVSAVTNNQSQASKHEAVKTEAPKHKPQAKLPAKPETKTKPAAKPVIQPAPVSTAGSQGQPAELKSKAGQRYALQLTASSERAAVLSYALKHSPSSRYWIYQTAHDGKPWFVLVQGDYASSAQAKAAVSALPAALQAGRPWPKSFAQIQKEMN